MPAGQVLFEPFIIINKVFSLKSNYLSLFAEKFTSIWIVSCSFLCSGRNRHPKLFCNKVVLRNFANFTGKHLFQSLFFNKVGAGISPAILLKKRLRKTFSCKFFEIFRNSFIAHLRWLILFSLEIQFSWYCQDYLTQFQPNIPLLYPLKTLVNKRLYDVLRGYRKRTCVNSILDPLKPNRKTGSFNQKADSIIHKITGISSGISTTSVPVNNVTLVFLTFNTFYTLFWFVYCWLWASKCRLGYVMRLCRRFKLLWYTLHEKRQFHSKNNIYWGHILSDARDACPKPLPPAIIYFKHVFTSLGVV